MKASGVAAATVALLSVFCLAATDRSASANPPSLQIHPKVFSLIDCWLSNSERPVVTEVNLDAVEKNGNEFHDDGVARDGEWMKAPGEGSGFMRYRVLVARGNRYQVE